MAGIWYRTGTVALTNGSKRVTGTGTTWLDQATGPVIGNTFWGPDNKPYEVERVVSNTTLDLVETYAGATIASTPYKINTTEKFSVASLAGQVAATLQYAQAQYSNMSLWASGDLPADVPVVLPDGVSTKDVPNVAKMLSLIAAKLTETAQLKALDVPSSVFGRARLADASAAAQLTALGASAFGQARLADANAAAQRSALGTKSAALTAVLGTVTGQDANGATGAIIEFGSNANGYYLKLAGGVLICFGTFSFLPSAAGTAIGSMFRTTSPAINFPVIFGPAVDCVIPIQNRPTQDAAMGFNVIAAKGSGYFTLHHISAALGPYTVSGDYVAIGRWY